jgi:hypothetical protein
VLLPEVAALSKALEVANALKEVAAAAKRVNDIEKLTQKVQTLLSASSGSDPNRGEAMRMAAARRFFAKLDMASASMAAVFAEAMSFITAWQANPDGLLRGKLLRILWQLKIELYPRTQLNTNLFTDIFLYDMLKEYVKSGVTLSYTTNSLDFPGGDYTHLSPDDHYFDSAGGRYVMVKGLSQAGCNTIYERFGKNSENAAELSKTGRTPVSRPGDLVKVWEAAFVRGFNRQVLKNGKWVNG